MLLGNVQRDMYSTCRTTRNVPYLTPLASTPLSSSSTITRTPITPQQTMNYARMSYRYTTVTLLSMRPPPEVTIFPDHLIEQRFLDEENFIDLDRMLVEKAGKFDLESFNMRDGPIMPSRIHKYDFSDPVVIEKVKNRRPKDPLTPQQVAALTSVVTRHQPSSLLSSHQVQSSHVWIDDYSRRQMQFQGDLYQNHLRPQPSMPYQRQNPNQCETYTNHIKSFVSDNQSIIEQKNDNIINETNTIPILQRLFQAQQRQQSKQRQIDSSQMTDLLNYESSTSGHYQQGLSAFCTPATPQQSYSNNTFEWSLSANQNEKDVLAQLVNEHLKCSTTMQTPATPSIDIGGLNNVTKNTKEDNGEQSLYSAPPSPTQLSQDSRSPLENWFGTDIYTNAYPRMPSNRVVPACDLE